MGNFIDIKKLDIDELIGVISVYPWYGGARKELCIRMQELGGAWSLEEYANAALHIGDRRQVAMLLRQGNETVMSDERVAELIKSYIASHGDDEKNANTDDAGVTKKVRVAGGDYFSQSEYDHVKKSDDNILYNFKPAVPEKRSEKVEQIDIYTETLAQIYAEQGYFEQAKAIYSKLILAYPEKNAYFASLIEKLDIND